MIPERARSKYDQIVGTGGLTENEKEFICKEENYDPNAATPSNRSVPFTVSFYRSYTIDCSFSQETPQEVENIPVRIEFNMFGTLCEDDYNLLLTKYRNDIYIPDGFSANETNLLGHNKYFTMVVRENVKGSFGILDDLYLLKKLFLQSWRMKIFYQILSTPKN